MTDSNPPGQDTIDHIAKLITLNVAMCATGGQCRSPQPTTERISSSSSLSLSSTSSSTAHASSSASTAKVETRFFTTSNLGPAAELRTVIETYLVPGAAKELNIPPALREAALKALQTSSHPAHLKPVAEHVYLLLKNCSHRNFVRLGVSNGTYETICVATSLGIILTLAGFLFMFLRAFYRGADGEAYHPMWEAFGAWPMWWLGISLILSGLRGSCFFLLLFSRRQPLPWERYDDDDDDVVGVDDRDGGSGGDGDGANNRNEAGRGKKRRKNPVLRVLSRLMIFDRKLKVKDEHLRKLQFRIVVQSLIGGAAFASVGVLLFLFLPIWSETARRW